MCWGCRPSCGNCKPPLEFYIDCYECGAPLTVTREQYLMYFDLPHRKTEKEKQMRASWDGSLPICQGCGKSLEKELRDAIRPADCPRCGIICGYPCGVRTLVNRTDPCKNMVPLKRSEQRFQEEVI